MSRVSFSRKNSPITVKLDGVEVGRLERNFTGTHFVVSLYRVQWRNKQGKYRPTTRGGSACVWIKRLYDAKELVTLVCLAYSHRLLEVK